MKLDLLVGSGGVLSHAPLRSQSAHMLVDSFLPEGITELAVDSIFMMPQLGVLSEVKAPGCDKAAMEVFDKDCLIYLAISICPVGHVKEGKPVVRIKADLPDGTKLNEWILANQLLRYDLSHDDEVEFEIEPASGFDVGEGKGKKITRKLRGGVVGLVIDTRGRPFQITKDMKNRVEMLNKWDISKNYKPKSHKDGV